MVQLNKHPILLQAHEVIGAIEECGASEKLTEAVIKASNLLQEIDKLVDERLWVDGNRDVLIRALKRSITILTDNDKGKSAIYVAERFLIQAALRTIPPKNE